MVALLTAPKAQTLLAGHVRARRLAMGLTQEGLAVRSGVPLPTLRKFEQKGLISLESFLKVLLVLDALSAMVDAIAPQPAAFASIDEVIKADNSPVRKKGWRK